MATASIAPTLDVPSHAQPQPLAQTQGGWTPPRHPHLCPTRLTPPPQYLNQLFGEGTPLIFGNLDGGDHPVPLPSPQSGVRPRGLGEILRDGGAW